LTPEIAAIVGSLIGAGAGVTTTLLTVNSAGRKTDHERIASLEARVDTLESGNRKWVSYVQVLRAHIYAEKPPPPPEWPEV